MKEFTLLKDDRIEDGKRVNAWGRMDDAVRGGVDNGVLFVIVEDWPGKLDASPRLPTKLNAPVSTILREAMIVSISHS